MTRSGPEMEKIFEVMAYLPKIKNNEGSELTNL